MSVVGQSFEHITCEVRDGAARIVLDEPEKLNALSLAMGRDVLAALDAIAADDSICAVMITGAGRGFSSGADLSAERPMTDAGKPDVQTGLNEVYNRMILAVRELPKPVVAAVNGPAVGVGCSLALACDLILASRSAYFLLAFANIGLTIDGGASAFLPARIGQARAAELGMLAERLPAETALEWGLINRVVEDAELAAEAGELLARLAAGPTLSYAATKRLLNAYAYRGLDEQLALEAEMQQRQAESDDFPIGVISFFSKQPPEFTGR